jgi:hypothetical protein
MGLTDPVQLLSECLAHKRCLREDGVGVRWAFVGKFPPFTYRVRCGLSICMRLG